MDLSQTRAIVVLSVLLMAFSAVVWWQGAPQSGVDPEATALVWEVDVDKVVDVLIAHADGGTIRVTREESGWRMVEPFAGRADAEAMDALLQALGRLHRGIPVAGVDAPPAMFGLGEPPAARVTVVQGDGARTTVTVGDAAPVGSRTYARGADGGIVAVRGDLTAVVQGEPSSLLDARVFAFDPGAVRSVRITSPDGVLDIAGSGHDWTLRGVGRADPDRVDDLLVGLLQLRFDPVLPLAEPVTSSPVAVEVEMADGSSQGLRVGVDDALGVAASTLDARHGMLVPGQLLQLRRGPTDVAVRQAFGIRLEHTTAVTAETPLGRLDAQRTESGWASAGRSSAQTAAVVEALAAVPATYAATLPPEPAPWGMVIVTEDGRVRRFSVGAEVVDGFRVVLDESAGLPVRVPADTLGEALGSLASSE